MLNIKKEQDNDKLTFALEGRLDTVTSPELESAIKESLDGVKELVMDFETSSTFHPPVSEFFFLHRKQ